MKINFDAVLCDLAGEPMKGEVEDATIQLKTISINALLASYQDEQTLSGEDKLSRYKLAQKIHVGGEQELSAEEASLLKRLIGKGYSPLIVGQTYEMIEGKSSEE